MLDEREPCRPMPRRSDAKQKMISAAGTLFGRKGYDGSGLSDILAESGAPKGSFYHHFPEGKEELAEAVVLQAGAAITALVKKAFADTETFEEGVSAMSGSIADWFETSGYAEGCPITSVLLATVPQSQRLHAACRSVLSDWSNAVAEAARRHELEDKAEMLGEAMVLAIEGAWVLSRVVESTSPFETATKMISALAKVR
ncbi:TetR/AcrR family transcriptional regulator [Parvularcula maris]|uniref:TetR/AcrR family transcriptional regulator n=1 Tax=Parvularcula maris TaxID=2965077 RepID=A0A9X2RIT9_9PROT|nr:TetR/AcrR family transcriptional regulator [Parvularcula maris]MCQ8186404.1 TetR/AcrR family transcriptional regulator [Parvularcula maris]